MAIADFSTHQNFVSDRIRATRSRMLAAAGVIDVRVRIEAGLQAGAERVLRLAKMSVGSGPDNDLIMIDPAVGDTQALVWFKRSMFGTLADVRAADGPVTIGDHTIEPGETLAAVKLPMTLEMGQNKIVVRGENQRPARTKRSYSGSFFAFDPILTASILALAVLMVWSLFGAYVINGNSRHEVTVNAPQVVTAPQPVATRDWPAELQREVDAAGLGGTLSVVDDGSGLIRVAGLIPTGQDSALRNLQGWYDSQPAAPTVIWNISRDTALEGMPKVSMVRFSEPPQVLLANGATVQLGEQIVDGWVLSSLSTAGMVLSRGAEQSVLTYDELMK